MRSNLTRLWLTVTLMALMLIAAVALLIAGPLFGSIAESAGMGDTGRTLVQLLRYPAGFAALLLALLLLYALGPAGTAAQARRASARGAAGNGAVGAGLDGLLLLRRQLRQLRQDLRHARAR